MLARNIYFVLSLGILLLSSHRAAALYITQPTSNPDATYCADVQNGSTSSGAPVVAHPCNASAAEQWSYVGQQIVNAASGLCLTESGSGQAMIATCGTSSGQYLGALLLSGLRRIPYRRQRALPGCGARGGSADRDHQLQRHRHAELAAPLRRERRRPGGIETEPNGGVLMSARSFPFLIVMSLGLLLLNSPRAAAFYITQPTSAPDVTYCVDVQNGSHTSGAPVVAHPCNDTAAEQWSYVGNQLVNTGSGKCLARNGSGLAVIIVCNSSYREVGQQWATSPNSGFQEVLLNNKAGCLELVTRRGQAAGALHVQHERERGLAIALTFPSSSWDDDKMLASIPGSEVFEAASGCPAS